MPAAADSAGRAGFVPISPHLVPPTLFARRKHWAERFGIAPVLPMSRVEMDALGWECCDVILVTGDAYVDHPSFGMALVGRLLESQGFRVGIIAQPDWRSAEPFRALGRPTVMWGVTAGNMDSMVNRYTADRRLRHDDAYTPGGAGGQRPDRAVIVYAQRCREAFSDVPIVLGGIEASLRRIAHYDYWSDRVRRSILLDAKADLLVYGNGERAIVEIAHRLAAGEGPQEIDDLRGTAFHRAPGATPADFSEIDSREIDTPGAPAQPIDPYADTTAGSGCAPTAATAAAPDLIPRASLRPRGRDRARTVIRLPDSDAVTADPVLYAHASRLLHVESNPGNARALVQRHGDREVWLNPPPLPLSTPELDRIYELPYTRRPHPRYGDAQIPAYDMIRFSVTIMRGCFGGCSFCSITEHEGRVIQNRSETSILREIGRVRDTVPGFTGVISDIGGPTANMYRLACKSPQIEAACRLPSCVYPQICSNLKTDHGPLIELYKKARAVPGVKKVLVASGVRYDLAATSPEYVRELASHHVGGYLKIAPEHTESGPLSKMLKPGIGTFEKFKRLFNEASEKAGKKQYLIPYFIASHPGTTDRDMLALAQWLKRNRYRADQVQTFLPSPMATATAMYHSGRNPLHKLQRDGEIVPVAKGAKARRLHKAFLRYHDPANWPLLRQALRQMGRADLIGNGPDQLIPSRQPAVGTPPVGAAPGGAFRTQHARRPQCARPRRAP
ncbi:MAG TPA: YgiQ family radical SAM protein [Polyangia bacterium]|nr:YgiQ family radical SAM protein [Polyangia bacterium]